MIPRVSRVWIFDGQARALPLTRVTTQSLTVPERAATTGRSD